MVNDYFWIRPFWRGWSASAALRVFPQPRYSENYLPANVKKSAIGSVQSLETEMNEKNSRPPVHAVKDYYDALKAGAPVDYFLILSTETTYSVPPLSMKTELASTHPNNLAVQKALRRCHAINSTGKTSAVLVVDPPYIAEIFPEKMDEKIVGRPVAPIEPHSFRLWDDVEKQEKSFRRKTKRAEIYSEVEQREYYPPVWEKNQESLRLRGLESALTEKLLSIVNEKCREGFYVLIPNSTETKKRIKQAVIEKSNERFDKKLADIVGAMPELAGMPSYQQKGICASEVWKTLDHYLEEDFGISIEESAPQASQFVDMRKFAKPCNEGLFMCEFTGGETCCKNSRGFFWDHSLASLIESAFADVNKECNRWGDAPLSDERRQEVLKYLRERKVLISSINTILKELNKDLDAPLKPLDIPIQEEARKIDAGVSDVAGSYDEVQFVLRREGCWEVPEEVRLAADAGKFAHSIVKLSAESAWQKAIEQSRVVSYRTGEGDTINLRVTPDSLSFYNTAETGVIEILPVELKSGSTPFDLSKPKLRHWEQVAGQAEIMRKFLCSEGKEVVSRFAAIHYMSDYAFHKPWTYRVPVGSVEGSRKQNIKKNFFSKAKNFVRFQRACRETPELLIKKFQESYKRYPHIRPALRPEPIDKMERRQWRLASERLKQYLGALRVYKGKHSL